MNITEIKTIEDVKVSTYAKLLQKQFSINNLIKSVIDVDENGISHLDYTSLGFLMDIEIIKLYTDIEISPDIETKTLIDAYDFLCEHCIIEDIKDQIGKDFYCYFDMLNNSLEQKIENNNSLVNVLSGFLNKALAKIPDDKTMKKIISDIPKMVNKIKPENLEIIKSAFNGKKE